MFSILDCEGCKLVSAKLPDCQQDLASSEGHLILGATAHRVREVKGGRALARAGLRELGVMSGAVTAGKYGEPIWPTGYCGSIAHSPSHAVALVAACDYFQSVGVDICDSRPLGDDLENRVWTAQEKESLAPVVACLPVDAANVAFSVKEAFFKCQFPLTGLLDLGFQDVVLTRRDGSLMAVSCSKIAEKYTDLATVWATLGVVGGMVFPCVYWPTGKHV